MLGWTPLADEATADEYQFLLEVLAEYRRFASPFATLRQASSAITQTVTLASAIDLE